MHRPVMILVTALAVACAREQVASPQPKGAETAAIATGSAAALPSECNTVSIDGYCKVAFGMTKDEAIAASPVPLDGLQYVDFDDPMESACYYLSPSDAVGFMLVRDSVERIDVVAPGVRTPEGAQVGMSLDEVETLYPDSVREPNFYSAPDENLIAKLNDSVFVLFEEDSEGIIRAYRVGREPAVKFVEGCQ